MSEAESTLMRMLDPAFSREIGAISGKMNEAFRLSDLGMYDSAINILQAIIQDKQQSQLHDLIRRAMKTEMVRILTLKAIKLTEQGKYSEAHAIYIEAIDHTKESFDEGEKFDAMSSAAENLMHLGKYQKSFTMFRFLAERQKERYRADHRRVLTTRSKLAKVVDFLGDHRRSLSIYKNILDKMKNKFGPDDHLTLTSQMNMAITLMNMEKYQEALEVLEDVHGRRMRLHGPDDDQTLIARGNLAKALHKLNRLDEALNIFDQVFVKRKRLLGQDHPDIIRLEGQIAIVLGEQGKHSEAIEILSSVLMKQQGYFGHDCPDTKATSAALEEALRRVSYLKLQSPRDKFSDTCMRYGSS